MKRNVLAVCLATALLAVPVAFAGGSQDRRAASAQTLAVIGDIPYGPEQIAAFPSEIKEINADPNVSGNDEKVVYGKVKRSDAAGHKGLPRRLLRCLCGRCGRPTERTMELRRPTCEDTLTSVPLR